jgi:FAD dependent oxidoreductase TIGR03364
VAVVGAGILGLACAYELARRGLRVAVFERRPYAQGASARNFGLIWPIGQPSGPRFGLALRSRELWLRALREAGLWHAPTGSLHLARHEDEEAVLREFVAQPENNLRGCELLSATRVTDRFPAVRSTGLRAGLWSPLEMGVEPRQVLSELPRVLHSMQGVAFHYETTVLGFDGPNLRTSVGSWTADRVVICAGADFQELAPQAFAESGLVRCKLQMMRFQSPDAGFRLGAALAGGLTLRHYDSFAACPTLPNLARRLDRQYPRHGRFGIHVLATQTRTGELVIGDSHEYGDDIEPYDKPEIEELVLDYFHTLAEAPDLRIVARWHGVYVKHPTEPFVTARPAPNALALTGVGGAGMTLSFGLAERAISEWLGE